MKKFVRKIQGVGQKAHEIRQMVASAPPRFAELRETVLASAGQLQHLRADVQSAVTTLRTDSEERLIEALREIDAGVDVFRAAGYHLDDVEMELAIPQRLIVHLEKVADAGTATLRSLMQSNTSRPTTHAILAALVKAEEMADKVDLTNLGYHKLMVHVGTVPNVRLCWCSTTPVDRVEPAAVPPPPGAAASAGPQLGESAFGTSFFSADSFFERTARPAVASVPKAEQPAVVPPAPASGEPAVDWRRDALARFKKMPDLSK
jgi:hypothetical protein